MPNENVSLEGTKNANNKNTTSAQRSVTQSATYASLTPQQQALVNQLQAEFGIVELTPAQTAGMQVQSFSDYQSAAADLSNAINQLNAWGQDLHMSEILHRSQSHSRQVESLRRNLALKNMIMRQAAEMEVITPQSRNGAASFLHLE